MESGVVGDPNDPATEVGPLVNEKQLEEILAGIERGKAEGGTVLAGGERARRRGVPRRADAVRGRRRRRVPLLRGGLRPGHLALPLLRRSTRRSSRANAVEFGLSAAIFTSSLGSARSVHGARSRPGSSASTARPPASTCTCRSAGSRARASARTSRAAPRGTSTPSRSLSTKTSERWLVTGALGCLGAWTVATLAREGAAVVALDLGSDRRAPAPDREQGRARRPSTFVQGDITEPKTISHTVADHGITHIVHLAALQVPFCKADPVLGAQVNVAGTVNVFEAAKQHGLAAPIAYASSAAVYDQDGEVAPRTLYGVYKLANEGTGRVYWQDDGVASIGLRPFSVYGPGRDQGITAGPTLAIDAAVRGAAVPHRLRRPDAAPLRAGRRPGLRRRRRARRRTARTRSASAVRRPRSPTSSRRSRRRSRAPRSRSTRRRCPSRTSCRQPWFDAPLTPLEQGIRETAEVLRSVI